MWRLALGWDESRSFKIDDFVKGAVHSVYVVNLLIVFLVHRLARRNKGPIGVSCSSLYSMGKG